MALFGLIGWKRLKNKEVPRWVDKAADDWADRYVKRTGHSPYDVYKCFWGNRFVYKLEFRSDGIQGPPETVFYKKKKKKGLI